MRNALVFKSSLVWITFLELCLLVFLVIQGQSRMQTTKDIVIESLTSESSADSFDNRPILPSKSFGGHVCTDFSILPYSKKTSNTKYFLENIHTIGYVGSYGTFQNIFERLTARQIVANLLFTPEGIKHIKTVPLNASMLSVKQLRDALLFARILIHDINNMLQLPNLNQDQINVLCDVLGRLMFLKSEFRSELVSLNAFNKSLEI